MSSAGGLAIYCRFVLLMPEIMRFWHTINFNHKIHTETVHFFLNVRDRTHGPMKDDGIL
jgi:hypothetical protein